MRWLSGGGAWVVEWWCCGAQVVVEWKKMMGFIFFSFCFFFVFNKENSLIKEINLFQLKYYL